jgi:uncharacterized protein YecT (DUF1311 family)
LIYAVRKVLESIAMLMLLKRLSCVLLFVGGVHAQTGVRTDSATKSEWDAFYAKQKTIRQRGTEVLESEQARSKADLCAKAESSGNAAIGACLVAEGKTTDQNYLSYTRSIGALLRLPAPGVSAPKVSKQPIPFDAAENAWRSYRDQSCKSMATQWEGGDQAPIAYADCRLTLTWNHMNELANLYSDLWH